MDWVADPCDMDWVGVEKDGFPGQWVPVQGVCGDGAGACGEYGEGEGNCIGAVGRQLAVVWLSGRRLQQRSKAAPRGWVRQNRTVEAKCESDV